MSANPNRIKDPKSYKTMFLDPEEEESEDETEETSEEEAEEEEEEGPAQLSTKEIKELFIQTKKKWITKHALRDLDNEITAEQTRNEVVPVSAKAINFDDALGNALKIFGDQALVDQDPSAITLESIELSKAKANSFLDAVNNVINISHLNELVRADDKKFKRDDELDALNPLLQSFRLAALLAKKNLTRIIGELEKVYEEIESGDINYAKVEKNEEGKLVHLSSADRMANLQEIYGIEIDNLNKITAGLTRVIQLERFSGGRPWGKGSKEQTKMLAQKTGIGSGNGFRGEDSGEEEEEERKPRELSVAELRKASKPDDDFPDAYAEEDDIIEDDD